MGVVSLISLCPQEWVSTDVRLAVAIGSCMIAVPILFHSGLVCAFSALALYLWPISPEVIEGVQTEKILMSHCGAAGPSAVLHYINPSCAELLEPFTILGS